MAIFDIDAEMGAINFGLSESFFDDLFTPTPKTKATPKKTLDDFRLGRGRDHKLTGSSVRRTAFEHVLDRAGVKDFDSIRDFYSNVVKELESPRGSRVFQPIPVRKFASANNYALASNISKDEDDKLVIELSAPGRNKDDFKVEVLPDRERYGVTTPQQILKISAEQQETKEDQDGYVSGFAKNSLAFSRFLPKNSIVEDISAEYLNGVLVVTVPKKTEETKEAPSKLIAVT